MAEKTDGQDKSIQNGQKPPKSGRNKSAPFGAFTVVSIIAMLIAAAAMMLGSDVSCFADVFGATSVLLAASAVQSFRLGKAELSRKKINENKKNIDPRLSGSLDDINGIGSTLGTLAGISVIISLLFIADGAQFNEGSHIVPLLEAASRGLCIGASISAVTSKTSVRRSLFIVGSKTFGAKDGELIKKVCRSSHSAVMMKRLGRMACIRNITAIAVSLTVLITALSGVGLVYYCWQTALICMISVLVSETFAAVNDESYTDEKLPLFTKSCKLKCTLNVISFIIIAFGFIFTFPFRSVYTGYVVTYEYNYYDEIEVTPIISVPARNSENAQLFSGFLLASGLMLMAAAGAYSLSDGFTSAKQIGAELTAGAALLVTSVIYGAAVHDAALDFIQYLVVFSTVSLIIIINIISYLAEMRKSGQDSNQTK